MKEHRQTYLVIFSPTAMKGWAFDRNYHFIGTNAPLWAPICLEDMSQVEKGMFCVGDLPPREAERMDTLRMEGHVMLSVWTKYFG